MTESEILADFPDLGPGDLRAVLAFAADREHKPLPPPGSHFQGTADYARFGRMWVPPAATALGAHRSRNNAEADSSVLTLSRGRWRC
ncbi:MAG: hypothetical protein JOY62_13440 [Acidobacteriaceae bacterium]|nr:hypothetical protein [Acidobacteriaceae bacterium]MBV9780965.1 hypothetical protein [Acidobacteriaceae bacterium]